MCGIAGALKSQRANSGDFQLELTAMADAIAHRGPDDHGVWLDAESGIGLAHRRLSIVDLSPLGHQPMFSASQRYVISFNGEIYNYRDLRSQLISAGFAFKSTSDTEVLLAAIEHWGVADALSRCVGMFAIGLWDRQERVLYLARDRFGEKPLYFARLSGSVVFGSELKALRPASGWSASVDRDALASYMRFGFIAAPHSVFQNVRKVRPAHFVRIAARAGEFQIDEVAYWDALRTAQSCMDSPLPGNDADQVEAVNQALEQSIKRQMVADVPVGAFLSGGIDSSLTVALMQRLNSQPVRTFSMGFTEEAFNEAPYAQAVARHLGTRHTELIVTPADALNVVPSLPGIYDEPFADSSQIPTFLVSKMAREAVTVSLSGDAADELFGGYGRYPETIGRWKEMQGALGRVRSSLGRMALNRTHASLLGLLSPAALVAGRDAAQMADFFRDRATRWSPRSLMELYRNMISICRLPAEAMVQGREPVDIYDAMNIHPAAADPVRQLMYADMNLYLPDDILVKVDRAAMAVSLETRVPFLDPDVVAAAWRTPTSVHFRDGRGKWVLRQILARHVPESIFDRPKKGFAVPMARWLRGELRDWAAALLNGARLRNEGYFDAQFVERRWHQHLSGQADWSLSLWPILSFQAWREKWGA